MSLWKLRVNFSVLLFDNVPTKCVLLTGAGFSKNFGGWTGAELKEVIINALKSDELKQIFVQEDNYESAYNLLTDAGEIGEAGKIEVNEALIRSYADMCENMRQVWRSEKGRPGHLFGIFNRAFLSLKGDSRPFLFTLNQDLFLEDKFGWFSPFAPNLELKNKKFCDLSFGQVSSVISSKVELSDIAKDLENHAGPAYFKLHGSFGWYSSDGKHRLVIGSNKINQIRDEPLLDWYFKVFKSTVGTGHKNILVIGYSFGDEHINTELINAVGGGSNLHIISPNLPDSLGLSDRIFFHQGTLADVLLDTDRRVALERQVLF